MNEYNKNKTFFNFKVLLSFVVTLMIVGYAGVTTVLHINETVKIGFKFDDVNIYIANLNLNGINKYNSISDDKMSFNLDVVNGTNSVDLYVANNAIQYDEHISINCVDKDLNEIKINQDKETKNVIYAQSILKYSFDVVSEIETQTYKCELKNIEMESNSKTSEKKKIIFAADGYESAKGYKFIDSLTYGDLPVLTKKNYIFQGWYDINDNLILSSTEIKSFTDEVLFAKFTPGKVVVNYNYNLNRTFSNNQYMDTGYVINWDKDFSINLNFSISESTNRHLLIGSYAASDSINAINLEVTGSRMRIWMANADVDEYFGEIPINQNIEVVFNWYSKEKKWDISATGSNTNLSDAGTYEMKGNDKRELRVGSQDYRAEYTGKNDYPFGTIKINKLIIREYHNLNDTINVSYKPNSACYDYNGWELDNNKVTSFVATDFLYNISSSNSNICDVSSLYMNLDAKNIGENASYWKDISGNKREGTYVGNPQKTESYVKLDGVDDGIYFETGLSDLFNNSFTFELTMSLTGSDARDVIFGNYNITNNINFERTASSYNTRVYWRSGQLDSNSTSNDIFSFNKLIHITYVYDKTNGRILVYRDGILKHTFTSSYYNNTYSFTNAYIGRDYRTGVTAMGGSLYSAKIFNKVLSASVISSHSSYELNKYKN